VQSFGLFAIRHTDLHGNTSHQYFTFYGSYGLVTDCGFHRSGDFMITCTTTCDSRTSLEFSM